MKTEQTTGVEAKPKKPYDAPELVEHGTVEAITGFLGETTPSGGYVSKDLSLN
jgi:hypothetical protein